MASSTETASDPITVLHGAVLYYGTVPVIMSYCRSFTGADKAS